MALLEGVHGQAHGVHVLKRARDGVDGGEHVAGVPELNQPDGIHPNAEGAERVAAHLWATLEPLLVVLREQLDEDGIPESFYFYDLNGKVSVDLSPNDRISVASYAGRDQVVVPFGDDARFDLDYGNRTGFRGLNNILRKMPWNR